MAFAATASTSVARSFSIGPIKTQIMTFTAVSGDTSGTITADRLTTVMHVLLDGGLALTAAPTFSGNVITLAFTNPGANAFGSILVLGV